ncbi:MAG TPA: hypothetical protein VGQ11_07690 [Candidatus Acidoferrales bacterium]|nr:hypothetical protein [Candidatus Acidoferrales bacterium]
MNAPKPTSSTRQRRVAVGLEMRVGGKEANGLPFEDTVLSGNVSRTGASFYTLRDLKVDMELDVRIPRRPGDPEDSDFISKARIVRVQPGSEEREILVGVQFLDRHFHRVYVSEETS